MKNLTLVFSVFILSLSCENKLALTNNTRAGGYALGERVALRFSLSKTEQPPDSIDVSILERKTGYSYSFKAGLDNCDTLCGYSAVWDGRKPDGRWPSGGPYLVYASTQNHTVYSDTVEIGLAD